MTHRPLRPDADRFALEEHPLRAVYRHGVLRAAASLGLAAAYYGVVLHVLFMLLRGAAHGILGSGSLLLGLLQLWAAREVARRWIFAWVRIALDREPLSREVTAKDQPALFSLVREVARDLDVEAPESLDLAALPTAYSWQLDLYGVALPLRGLGIGIPLFSLLGRPELRALLGHELGHLAARGDHPWLARKLAWQAGFHRGVLAGSRPEDRRSSLYLWYCRAQLALLWPFGGLEEIRADEGAVAAQDHGTYALALARIAQLQVLFGQFLRDVRRRRARPANIFSAFREHLEELDAADLEGALARYRRFDAARIYNGEAAAAPAPAPLGLAVQGCGIMPQHALDGHPTLEARVRYLREVQQHYPYRRARVQELRRVYRPDARLERSLTVSLLQDPRAEEDLPMAA